LQPEAGLKIHVDIQCTYKDNTIKTKMSCDVLYYWWVSCADTVLIMLCVFCNCRWYHCRHCT